jgi:hypothetical protein
MLIEFSVANYRSFKEKVTFSMVAANIVAKDKHLDEANVFAVDDELKLLKSAAIYGANASGKSNLGQALSFMKWFMVNSSKETQSTEKIGIERFRLSTETEDKPSLFEIVFLTDKKTYRYGFEVNRDRVVSEWLFYVTTKRETKLFDRKYNDFKVLKTYKAEGIQGKTRHNALFLSVSAQFNVKIAEQILAWLTKKLNIISGLRDLKHQRDNVQQWLAEDKNKEAILRLIRKLDLGIEDVKVQEREITSAILADIFPDELKKFFVVKSGGSATSIGTLHQKFDSNGHQTSMELFSLEEQESEGTKKVFALGRPLFDTLSHGKVLVIDEFDAKLHPLISRAIVDLFNSTNTNPNNAQFIFMTHDTNLLSNKIFRRDQIWFTEKNRQGATDLYSLAEYNIPNDASFESDYIKGKYGAIPYIMNLNNLIS